MEQIMVSYTFNKSRMPFFVISMYPHYRVEGDSLVHDTSAESDEMRESAKKTLDLISRIQKRLDGGRIPRTWIKRFTDQESFVRACLAGKAITREWHDCYFQAVRYLESRK